VLEEGKIHEAIIDIAREKDCDLIITGRRGLSGIERAFMGSVTARVIGYSPIDVLVMPGDSVLKWDNILLAVDGSKYSDIAANKAISMARMYGRELNILSVVDVNEEFYAQAPDMVDEMVSKAREMVQDIEQTARLLSLQTSDFVREGEAHKRIIGMANQVKADLICLGSHGRTGLRRLLMGSVAEKVIGHATCPVLVAKAY
jgi:nucleotide-binding universal stress UspA family protein